MVKTMSKDLQTLINPFAPHGNPKVPDGQCAESSGLKQQASQTFTVGESGKLDILMFPGLNCGCIVIGAAGASYKPIMTYSNIGILTNNAVSTDNTLATESINCPVKWRIVSQGLQLTNVNALDNSDGWWEAVYFHPTLQPTEYGVWSSAVDANENYIGPGEGLLRKVANTNLTDYNNYTSGKMTKLKDYMFKCHHNATVSNFQTTQPNYDTIGRATGGAATEVGGWAHRDFNNDSSHNALIVRDFIYGGLDCVHIRVHGTSNTTEILAHLCSNQEHIFADETILKKYHTPSYKHTHMDKVKTRLVNERTAAFPKRTTVTNQSVSLSKPRRSYKTSKNLSKSVPRNIQKYHNKAQSWKRKINKGVKTGAKVYGTVKSGLDALEALGVIV